MGARCKTCQHPQRAEIDADLATGVPVRTVARRYGLTKHSISRHKLAGHIPRGVVELAVKQQELAGIDAERLRAMTGDGVVYALWRRRLLLDQALDQAVVAEQPHAVAQLGRAALEHDRALATIVGTIAPKVTTTTMARKPDRFAREYDMIVTRRRRLLGFGGLDELLLVGLWRDENGRKRQTELVRLGTASSVDTALKLAEAGLTLHPKGTHQHRRYRDWHARLRAAEWAMVRAEARYRRLIAELSGGVPVYNPELVAAE